MVIKIDVDKAKHWTDKEVLTQWHKGTLLTNNFAKGEDLNEFELKTVNDSISQYRQRLIDISWFIRLHNHLLIPPSHFSLNELKPSAVLVLDNESFNGY